MIRKLFALVVMTVATFALSIGSASGQSEVEVENAGEHTLTGENTISIHSLLGTTEIAGLKCEYNWHLTSSHDGHVSIAADFASHVGSQGPCDNAEPCDDHEPWEGQIEKHSPHWAYAMHLTLCLEQLGGIFDSIPFAIECEVSVAGDEVHCGGVHDGQHDAAEEESHLLVEQVAPGVFAEFNIEGELFIEPPLQLMHVEEG